MTIEEIYFTIAAVSGPAIFVGMVIGYDIRDRLKKPAKKEDIIA